MSHVIAAEEGVSSSSDDWFCLGQADGGWLVE
jgi:hypothetical protein